MNAELRPIVAIFRKVGESQDRRKHHEPRSLPLARMAAPPEVCDEPQNQDARASERRAAPICQGKRVKSVPRTLSRLEGLIRGWSAPTKWSTFYVSLKLGRYASLAAWSLSCWLVSVRSATKRLSSSFSRSRPFRRWACESFNPPNSLRHR